MQKSQRLFLMIAAASGAVAVGLGAFGAHALKNMVEPDMLEVWKTAVFYQFIHTLTIFIAAVCAPLWNSKSVLWACLAWTGGILLFSGSLYALVLTGIKILGAITPIGGVLMILGWLLLAYSAARLRLTEK
jgi:uncharacterized membrane protein YgdD (TMEM256/DUF423 family)